MKFFKNSSQERIGEVSIMTSVIFFAGFPILINYATRLVPAIFFAGVSTVITAIMMFIVMIVQKRLGDLKIKKAWFPMSMVFLFIIVLPFPLLFTGTKLTSAINTSILLEFQVVFALIFGLIIGEKLTWKKLIGGLSIILGTALVLYDGSFNLNWGDMMIIFACIFFPIGNIFAKRAFKLVSPITVLFFRSIFGGLILIVFSLWMDQILVNQIDLIQVIKNYWYLILLNGLIISGISKVLWYHGLKRLDLGKATIIGMSFPAFSVIIASTFLKEIPSFYQFAGLIIVLLGLYTVMHHVRHIHPHVHIHNHDD